MHEYTHMSHIQYIFSNHSAYVVGIIIFSRVSCSRRGGVHFTLKGQGNFHMVMVSNVGGSGDVRAAWVKGLRSTWTAMHRNWGANWQSSVDLRGQTLSFKLTLVDGKTMVFSNVVPRSWNFGQTFSSSKQFRSQFY